MKDTMVEDYLRLKRLEARLNRRIEDLDARIKSFERKSSYSKIHLQLGLEYMHRKQELQKVRDGKNHVS